MTEGEVIEPTGTFPLLCWNNRAGNGVVEVSQSQYLYTVATQRAVKKGRVEEASEPHYALMSN